MAIVAGVEAGATGKSDVVANHTATAGGGGVGGGGGVEGEEGGRTEDK